MTLTDDLKKQAAKSNGWKWCFVAAAMLAVIALMYAGKKEDAYKVLEVAGEIIAVKVSDSNIEIISTTAGVSVTDVSSTLLQ